ncbi:hypothetical protein E4U43_003101, partial [Claviceps pusilla]
MDKKRASRLLTIPQLTIPHILVNNEFGDGISEDSHGRTNEQPGWTPLSTGEGASDDNAPSITDLGVQEITHQHPLSDPQSPQAPASRQGSTSGFSFELYEPEDQHELDSQPVGNDRSSPIEARDMLDDSVWMESIRRSATIRRHEKGSYRFGDL